MGMETRCLHSTITWGGSRVSRRGPSLTESIVSMASAVPFRMANKMVSESDGWGVVAYDGASATVRCRAERYG